MNTAAAFQATYSDVRLVKGRKVVQLVFEVPLEAATQAMDALGGMPNPASEVWCAIARLKPGKEAMPNQPEPGPHNTEPRSSETASGANKKSWHEMAPAQQAGILCNEKSFQLFLNETLPKDFEPLNSGDDAARFVREHCGVNSRSELSKDPTAAARWKQLASDYRAWMREPEIVS